MGGVLNLGSQAMQTSRVVLVLFFKLRVFASEIHKWENGFSIFCNAPIYLLFSPVLYDVFTPARPLNHTMHAVLLRVSVKTFRAECVFYTAFMVIVTSARRNVLCSV